MTFRRATWVVFLALFAALLGAYAVWLVASWKTSDGNVLEEVGTVFVIAGLPALVAALNVALVHSSRRALVVVCGLSAAIAIAAVVVAASDRDISGFVAAVTAVVLLGVVATVVAALRWDAGFAMIAAASIALLVGAGVGMLTWGGALPISVGLLIVAASTMNVARSNRLVPWWPIVFVIVVFAATTGGVTLIVLVPFAIVVAIVAFRKRQLKQRVHVAEDRRD